MSNQTIVGATEKSHFFQMPSIAMLHLEPLEYVLYSHYVWRGGTCYESMKTTEILTKLSAPTIRKLRAALADKGYITVTERVDETGNHSTTLVQVNNIWVTNINILDGKKDEDIKRIVKNAEGRTLQEILELTKRDFEGGTKNPLGGVRKELLEGTKNPYPKQYYIEQDSLELLYALGVPSETRPTENAATPPVTPLTSNVPKSSKTPPKAPPTPRPRNLHFEWVYELLVGKPYDSENKKDPHKGRVGKIVSAINDLPIEDLQAFQADYKRWSADRSHPNGLAFPLDGSKMRTAFLRWQEEHVNRSVNVNGLFIGGNEK